MRRLWWRFKMWIGREDVFAAMDLNHHYAVSWPSWHPVPQWEKDFQVRRKEYERRSARRQR